MPQNLRISELTDGGNVRVGDVFPANRGGQTLRMLYSGGGLVFRNPADEFVGATLAACRTARITYFTTTSTTAFQDFIANRFLAIVLNPTNSTDNVFETYTGSGSTYDDTMWVERTGTAQGIPGDVGAQARFSVFGYINSATAPTVAPTGGTFVQSTDTLTLPTSYTALPSTPASGSKTYVIEAVINPVVDADTVTLIWPVPAELPAYLAAAFAEAAQAASENAADRAEQAAGQAVDIPTGSPRGALVATSPTLPTVAVANNTVIAFGATEVWTVEADAPDGFEAGPTANNERLYLPDIHPAGSNGIWLVVEVDGVDIAESFISHGGIQGATTADRRIIVPVSVTADVLIRTGFWPRASTVASYIQITGNNDTLPANTVVKIYLAVVRGDPGSGPGGGLTEAQANTLTSEALAAAVTSNTETGITVTYNTSDGTFDFVVNVGVQEYVGENPVHDSTNNRITIDIRGLGSGDTLPSLSRIISIFPDPLGRQSDELSVVAHGVTLPLVDRDGQTVSARQITPGRLYEIFYGLAVFFFIQPVGLRPQDYLIRAAISEDETFTEAEILAGTESALDSDALTLPVYDDYIGSVRVTEPGSGYTAAPAVVFSGGGGTGAAATANVGAASGVERIFVRDIGFNYTSNPTVVFSGGGGTGAAATAVIQSNGQLTDADVTLTNAGSGYTSAPTISLVGGGGTAPRVVAFLEPDAGEVTGITVTSRGSGYTSEPDITIAGGGGSGAEARATLGEALFVGVGVPDDTGDITAIINKTQNLLSAFERIPGTTDVSAVPYKFWRSSGALFTTSSGLSLTIEQMQEFA